MAMEISGLRRLAERKATDGHLSAADAKAIIKAAGTGAAAVKLLGKLLGEYDAVFTDKAKSEMLKAIGETPQHLGKTARVTEATHRALLQTLNAVRDDLGRPLSSLPLGERFVEEPLLSERRLDGFHYAAMLPVGALSPSADPSDPNKATSFLVKRAGGPEGLTEIFGPFDVKRSGKAKAVQVTEADAGKTIKVKKGQDVVVSLPANPSTGYQWSVGLTDRTFGYPAKEEYLAGGAPGHVGSGGTMKFTWKTSSAYVAAHGHHDVVLEYVRGNDRAKRFKFSVEIE